MQIKKCTSFIFIFAAKVMYFNFAANIQIKDLNCTIQRLPVPSNILFNKYICRFRNSTKITNIIFIADTGAVVSIIQSEYLNVITN